MYLTLVGLRCSRCDTEFTFFKRRHHCRCCFREFCDVCTTKRALVNQFGNQGPQRVCDSCAAHSGARNELECISRLVPYLVPSAPELNAALKEFHDLISALMKKEPVYEEVTRLGCFVPILQLLQPPSSNVNMSNETRLLVLKVVAVIVEDSKVADVFSKLG